MREYEAAQKKAFLAFRNTVDMEIFTNELQFRSNKVPDSEGEGKDTI